MPVGWTNGSSGGVCEDKAFAIAADTLLGPTQRHEGTITHLWHPPAQRVGSAEHDAVWALAERYAAAEGDPEAMRALIKEHDRVSA